MSSSDQFSQSGNARAGKVGPSDDKVSRLSPDPGDRGIPSPIDGEELRRRAAEVRERTKQLVGNYVDSCVRLGKDIALRQEAMLERDRIRSELSASVARFALLLRALGEPPERTLVVIKTAFSEAAPNQDDDHRAVLQDVVKWVVDAYYAA